MAYLAQFIQVTGSELSDIACRDFFIENNIDYQKHKVACFQQYHGSHLSLFQGDFFQLNKEIINNPDWIYDRAALIALPESMQKQYVEHLKHFFSSHTRLFLVTLEFPEEQLIGPPFPITASRVETLFTGFDIRSVATNELEDKQFAQRQFDVDYLREKLYIITLLQ